MQITSLADVAQLGTILFVGAHPDDETFCAGSLLAAAAENGQTVVCVTATKGEGGSQDPERWPVEQLGEIRQKELDAALDILGITNHHVLDYPDGGCIGADVSQGAARIAEFITRYQPDTILTFGADGLTGHPDHTTVSRWIDLAVAQADKKPTVYHAVITEEQFQSHFKAADEKLNFFYNIDKPPLLPHSECAIAFTANDELCKRKQAAFAAMPSQYASMLKAFDQVFLREAFRTEAFVKA